MAVQMDVAFSSIMKGAGVVAGGPYFCAHGLLSQALGPCMSATTPIDVNQLVATTQTHANGGTIDPVAHLAQQKIWLFSSTADTVNRQPVMDALENYYKHFTPAANIFHHKDTRAQHSMPTLNFGSACAFKGDPYINDCHEDAAGEILQWIYGTLNPKTNGTLPGHLLEFDQAAFIDHPNDHSMANTGWVYVPADCDSGAACKLHVAFHGCLQYPTHTYRKGWHTVTYGDTFVKHAGYNAWADSNHIIVLYPQAQRSPKAFWDIFDAFGSNPKGCWDWWGYDDANYAKKTGRQMAAVKKMIDKITGNAAP
ncbi:MAG: PHA-depolymerase-like protein [Burkholderiaceae bacterium]|nr:MAG: PHA-depolymerase-like protein [Burkholderiaceae bacterium]